MPSEVPISVTCSLKFSALHSFLSCNIHSWNYLPIQKGGKKEIPFLETGGASRSCDTRTLPARVDPFTNGHQMNLKPFPGNAPSLLVGGLSAVTSFA